MSRIHVAGRGHRRALRFLRSSLFLPALAAVLLTVFLVSPVGNFPLGDGYFYGDNVRVLLVERTLAKSTKAMALAQTLWGTAFTLLFGKSYTVLRLSTLVLSVVSLWLTARLALESGVRRGGAVLCAAVVLVNPYFLNLSYSFMTEVPFIACSAASGLFYARALDGGRDRQLLLGGLFAVLAASIRQFGAVLPLSFLLSSAALSTPGFRTWNLRRAAAFLLPWLAAALAWWIFSGFGGSSPRHLLDYVKPPPLAILTVTLRSAVRALIYLGLFLLPLGAGILLSVARRRNLWSWGQWIALPLLSVALFLGSTNYSGEGFLPSRRMPLAGPILYDLGVGTLTLRDTWFGKMGNPVSLGDWWWVVTVLSILSFAAVIIHCLFSGAAGCRSLIPWHRGEGESDSPLSRRRSLFILLWGLVLLLAPYDTIVGFTIDRYFLPALPPLAVFAAICFHRKGQIGGAGKITAWSTCVLLYLFSLAALQDYMAWNTARWKGIAYLRHDLKVPDWKIDGGLEYNGLFTRDAYREMTGNRPFDWGPKGFYVLDDSYAISFHPRAGMSEVKRIPYTSWLGMEERAILVLTRRGEGDPREQ